MSTSANAVRFDDDSMWVDLDDGRRIEDISIDGLLAGRGDRTHGRLVVPA